MSSLEYQKLLKQFREQQRHIEKLENASLKCECCDEFIVNENKSEVNEAVCLKCSLSLSDEEDEKEEDEDEIDEDEIDVKDQFGYELDEFCVQDDEANSSDGEYVDSE